MHTHTQSFTIIHFVFSSDQLVVALLQQSIFRVSQPLFAILLPLLLLLMLLMLLDFFPCHLSLSLTHFSSVSFSMLRGWKSICIRKVLAIYAFRTHTFTVYEFKLYIQSGQSLAGWRPCNHSVFQETKTHTHTCTRAQGRLLKIRSTSYWEVDLLYIQMIRCCMHLYRRMELT